MSAGAVFKLIANDGKADRMIVATKLLNQRIKEVMCARKRAGKADITPTLVDLERTHILFVNAHFKPFAAIGFEYNKVRPQSGQPQFGSGITFSIPQFGDFFHDMVCRVRINQVAANQASLKALVESVTANATIVDIFGRPLGTVAGGTFIPLPGTPATYANFVRYCEYPGNALFELVKFEVNGNPLDQYDEIVPVMLEKFTITPNKRVGHDKLVGQQVELEGYGPVQAAPIIDFDTGRTPGNVISKNVAGQSNQSVALFAGTASTDPVSGVTNGISPSGVIGSAIVNLNPDGGVNADNPLQNQFDVGRAGFTMFNGPQVPKPVQPILEIWNKLRFWFCDDVRLSIASVSIPFGQRYIHVELANASKLLFEYPSIYIATAFGSRTPAFQQNGISSATIASMELYINNIFVNPEIHDIYIKRIGFSLIRVYRQQKQTVNSTGSDEKLLSQLKWPIEYMWVGLRPAFNIAAPVALSPVTSFASISGNMSMWHDWHRMTRQVTAQFQSALNTGGLSSPTEYWLPVPTVNSLSLTSHGIVIYDNFADTFYNAYAPFHYGGAALVTPTDPGALFVNMSLYPRGYQPAGHLNISRARETYLGWNSSYISPTSAAELLVVAIAINFLLITDGSAVLRYST